VALACLAALPAAAQQESATLSNGIGVQFLPPRSGGMATAVLVCPLPAKATDAQLADAVLLNRLLWHGGSATGRSIQEHEYRMFALRFGGSISSQVQPDALLIQYAMPAELLPEVFAHMQVQWSGLQIDPDRLEALKAEIISRERAALIATVERQLLREMERRIWSDLAYAAETYGSADALNAADAQRVQGTFALLRDPSRWTLIIDGAVETPELIDSLESTLGTIEKAEAVEVESQERGTTMLGNALQMPAQLSRHHAVLAYRLPAAGDLDTEAVLLLTELIRRSPQLAALRADLSAEAAAADLSVAADLRREAGMLYLTATWSSDTAAAEVLDRLRFLVNSVNGEGESAEAFMTARKTLALRYWTQRESALMFAAWVALREAVGAGGDFAEQLETIDAEDIKTLGTKLLTRENSLTLVTVVQ
jgi:predicted Zn-dependent peptidase